MEIWKDIIGYEGKYQVSSIGKVKSLNYNKSGKEGVMKGIIGKYGHTTIIFCLNGIQSGTNISRLVALHFIPNPLNLPCVLHKDETLDENGSLYNGEDNLYWGTQKTNIQDMLKKGRKSQLHKGKFGKDHPTSKKVDQYTKEGVFIKNWHIIMDVQRELGINQSYISKCCNGKEITAGGFKWEFNNL